MKKLVLSTNRFLTKHSALFIILMVFSLTVKGQLIVDNGSFFTEDEKTALAEKMQEIRDSCTVQTLLYTTTDLAGKSSIEYGKDLALKYRTGVFGINNGIIILISKNEREVRILCGYGLEWILSDDETDKILTQMVPFLKQDEFVKGIEKGLRLIDEQVSKVNWKLYANKLKNITQDDQGKIVKFSYTNKSGSTRYKYAIEQDPQFSNEFQIVLESGKTQFHLFYTKNMDDMVNAILTRKGITVFARLTDWKNKKLELLGIE